MTGRLKIFAMRLNDAKGMNTVMNKIPFVTKEKVEKIVKTYPPPFHIYDEKGIRENAKAVQEAFAWNRGFKE